MLRSGLIVLGNVVCLKMSRMYQVAGHCFVVDGERLCKAVESMDGFDPFVIDTGNALFSFTERDGCPEMLKSLYEFGYEDIDGIFGRTAEGYLLRLKPQDEEALELWCRAGEARVMIGGNLSLRLLRFAMWIGVGLMVAPYDTVAIHGSCIVYEGKAVVFLGESGTGKSTHTRLWVENIPGAFLLNDDSPFLRAEDSRIWAYGSPWSGKTPCYRQERYELKACVRLSQSNTNNICKLDTLNAYGAIHPSCPPAFAYDEHLYDHISSFLDKLLSTTPFYHLECLPDRESVSLSFKNIFNGHISDQN